MDLLDSTIVTIALPSIRLDLHASAASLEWVVAGYILAFAVGLITGGRLGDAYGRRRVFQLAVVAFVVASVACAAAPSPAWLVGARFAQGASAAMMVPQVLALIQEMFSGVERAKATGLYGAAAAIAVVSGPVIGGLLLQADILATHWRPIFLINVPIGAAAFAGTAILLRQREPTRDQVIDVGGVVLVTIALLLLVYPLIEGQPDGWPVWMFVLLVGSIPVGFAFAAVQLRRERLGTTPLVPPYLFRDRRFVAGVCGALLFFAGVPIFFVATSLTLQIGLGWSPLHTALTFLPWSIGVAAASGFSSNHIHRYGRRLPICGCALMAVGMAIVALVCREASHVTLLMLFPGILIAGIGLGLVAPTLVQVVTEGVEEDSAGSASGVINTAIQVGGVIGLAGIGFIFFHTLASRGYLSSLEVALYCEAALFAVTAFAMGMLPSMSPGDYAPAADTA
jgi:EmrB/QacA subfamily drug resistance transporter